MFWGNLKNSGRKVLRNVANPDNCCIFAPAKSGNKHYLKAYIFNPYIATTSSKILKSVYDIFTAAGWNFGVIGNGIENNITI